MKFFSTKRKLFLIGGVFLFIIYLIIAPHLLSYQKKNISGNYLIEDWVSAGIFEYFAENIYNSSVEKIYIPGRIIEECLKDDILFSNDNAINRRDYVPLLSNSVLIIDPSILNNAGDQSIYSLEIGARGKGALGYYPFFSVSINGNLVFSGFASDTLEYYKVLQENTSLPINSLAISFHNDYCDNSADRNLYIKSVKVNGKEQQLSQSNTIVSRTESVFNGYNNTGEFVKRYLVSLGIPSDKIEIIPYEKAKINATWSSAKAVSHYFKDDIIKEFNIVTLEKHSLRSYIAYRRLIDTNIGVGIFPVSSPKNIKFKDLLSYSFGILDETLSVIVTIFTPKT